MLNRRNLFAAIASVALLCVSTQVHADEIDFAKIQRYGQGIGSKANTLRNLSNALPEEYAEVKPELVQRSNELMTFLNTVSQNLAVIKNNPDNQQSLNWAIQYSHLGAERAERIESLMKRVKRLADRADDDNIEQIARNASRMADDVEDALRRIKNELD